MAKFLTDFKNGINSVTDYLDPKHHIKTELSGSLADLSRIVDPATTDTAMKEIICSLLAGRGLKLPNIQICISMNLDKLLNLPNLQKELKAPLTELANSMNAFLDHTKIDNVLGRINNVLAEATNIANMINFCSAPMDPLAIPNQLEQSMQSFLGAGKDLVDRLGTMPAGEIKGCLSAGFNCNAFTGGILGIMATNCTATMNGTLDIGLVNDIIAEAALIKTGIDDLIKLEQSVSGLYDNGGSDLSNGVVVQNENMGVLHNSTKAGIQGNTRIASQLKALYDSLGSYQVIHNDGTVYNNVFELFVDDNLMDILRDPMEPVIPLVEKQPVYNYCGDVVGFVDSIQQPQNTTSSGIMPTVIDLPGFDAAGKATDPASAPTAVSTTPSASTVNAMDISLLYLYAAESKAARLNMVGGIIDPFTNAADVGSHISLVQSAGKWVITTTGLVPQMTASNAPAPYVAASSYNTTGAWGAFDPTSVATPFAFSTGFLSIDLGSPAQANTYTIIPHFSTIGSTPRNWTFQGSVDGITWVTLDTQINQTLGTWTDGIARQFTIATPQSYRHFRMNMTANNGYAYTYIELFAINRGASFPTSLISTSFTASAVPTTCRLGVQATGPLTINTDLIGYVSRDGGATWSTATMVLIDTLADGTKYYEAAAIDVSAQPSGTAMQYKIVTTSANWISTDGVLLQWS